MSDVDGFEIKGACWYRAEKPSDPPRRKKSGSSAACDLPGDQCGQAPDEPDAVVAVVVALALVVKGWQ